MCIVWWRGGARRGKRVGPEWLVASSGRSPLRSRSLAQLRSIVLALLCRGGGRGRLARDYSLLPCRFLRLGCEWASVSAARGGVR